MKQRDVLTKLQAGSATVRDILDLYGERRETVYLLLPLMPSDEKGMLNWIAQKIAFAEEKARVEADVQVMQKKDDIVFQKNRDMVQEFQRANGLDSRSQENVSREQNAPSGIKYETQNASYGSFDLSSTEYRPLQTPAGQMIQAIVDPRTGDIIASDPRLRKPVNIGKADDFGKNAPILDIGLVQPELQTLFLWRKTGSHEKTYELYQKYHESSRTHD